LAIPVLVILAVLWAVVLVPPLLRSRSEARRTDSVGDFSYRLGVLSKTNGHGAPGVRRRPGSAHASAAPAPTMTPAQRRRRDVLLVLMVGVCLTLGLAAITGLAAVWVVQVLVDGLLVTYLLAIVRMRGAGTERRAKVTYLPNRARPELLLRRTGSS
jgi:hypothetical protein